MQKNLYFLCPSENLEAVIEKSYPQENYFLSSLGNSISFSDDFILDINSLIESKGIGKIIFILSNNNRFILDAMKNQEFKYIKELKEYYKTIEKRKVLTIKSYKNKNFTSLITSHILKTKINELNSNLFDWIRNKISIEGKIYDPTKNMFFDVRINIIEPESLFLN
tara:strand:+ start:117 stop:614 length:498 start_codon:yes stop_codon:yes gene_type:complete